ncbi:MAG: hypothetical protein ACLFWL_16065 [Candidatus Brocadiia bacterium]
MQSMWHRIRQGWKKLRQRPRLFYGLLLGLILTVLYALLQNGYWSAGNDSEYYLTLARNLAAGRGYVFNGLPFAHYPLGWPAFLAGLLHISRQFWFLNLVPKLLMIGTGIGYYVFMARRIAPRHAFESLLLTNILWWWYRPSYVLLSESLFLALFVIALLAADKVREDKSPVAFLALVVLGGMFPVIRWAGIVAVPLVCVVLISGEIKPRLKTNWICAVAACVIACGSFLLVNNYLGSRSKSAESVQTESAESVQTDGREIGRRAPAISLLLNKAKKLTRLSRSGEWISGLFWPPLILGEDFSLVGTLEVRDLSNAGGLILWAFVLILVVRKTREKHWIWLGAILYNCVFVLIWHPLPRYLLPVAPLLIYALFTGLSYAMSYVDRKLTLKNSKLLDLPLYLLLGAIVLPNLAILSVVVGVQRSQDYYGTYMAGRCEELIASGDYLRNHAPPNSKVGINPRYVNFGQNKSNTFGKAAVVMLTGLPVAESAIKVSASGPDAETMDWARANDIDYFLYQPPTSPWRIWHFRMPWLQKWVKGQSDVERNPYWELYRRQNGKLERVQLTSPSQPLKQLPVFPTALTGEEGTGGVSK